MKTMIGLLMALALAVAVAAVVLEQNAIGAARAEQKTLVSKSEEARRLAAQNQGIERLRAEHEEVVKLREENKELLKLRNEVRRLRREAERLGQLRTENQGLESRLQSVSQGGQPAELPADFIKREALTDAGLATPEATVQTYFWAACRGNVERMDDCTVNGTDLLGRNGDYARNQALEETKNFTGFHVKERRDISPDEVELTLESKVGGLATPMKLKLVNGQWKLEE